MQPWHRKAAIDGIKAALPFKTFLRGISRRIKPYSSNPQNDIGLLGDSMRQIDALTKAGLKISGACIVEIGSGWKPILPIMYRLCGAQRIITIDRERLIDLSQFKAALGYIRENIGLVTQRTGINLELSFDRVSQNGGSLDEALYQSCIEYRAPYDFAKLSSGIANAVVSRDVLEHIPEDELGKLMAHSRRVLMPNGFACHSIDMSDHWEHLDKSISRVNFLRYDGVAWKLAGLNSQNFQNRLRRFEYVKMIEANKFKIISVSGEPNEAALKALSTFPICPRYVSESHSELAIMVTNIVARKVDAVPERAPSAPLLRR